MDIIHLTPEEYHAIMHNNPKGYQYYFIWTGILVTIGYTDVKYLTVDRIDKNEYLVTRKEKTEILDRTGKIIY